MNQFYPKRLVRFVVVCSSILALLSVSRNISYVLNSYYNLTPIDLGIYLLGVLLLMVVAISAFGIFKDRIWAWIASVSYILYSPIRYILDGELPEVDYPTLVVVGAIMVFITAGVFLLSKAVRKYYHLKASHVLLAFSFPVLFYLLFTIDPVSDKSKVSLLYLDKAEEDSYYLGDSLFTGKVYSNNSEGGIELEGEIVNGLKEGDWKIYFKNGQIKSHYFYKKGKFSGIHISYFYTGEKREEMNFIDDKIDGLYQSWWAPNQLHEKGRYILNRKEGEWIVYEPNSQVMKIENYARDSLVSVKYEHH